MAAMAAKLKQFTEKKAKLTLQDMMVPEPEPDDPIIRMLPASATILLSAVVAVCAAVVLFVLLPPTPKYTYATAQFGASGAVRVPREGDVEVTNYGPDGLQVFTLFDKIHVYFRGPPVIKSDEEWLRDLRALQCSMPDPGLSNNYFSLQGVTFTTGGLPLECLPPNVTRRSDAKLYAVIPSATPWPAVEALAKRVAGWLSAKGDALQLVGVESNMDANYNGIRLVFGWPGSLDRPLVYLYVEMDFKASQVNLHDSASIFNVEASQVAKFAGCCPDPRITGYIYNTYLKVGSNGAPGCEEWVGCLSFMEKGWQCSQPWVQASCPGSCGACPGNGPNAWFAGNTSLLTSKDVLDLVRAHGSTNWLLSIYKPFGLTPLQDAAQSLFLVQLADWAQEVLLANSRYSMDPLFSFSLRSEVPPTVTERCQYVLANLQIVAEVMMSAVVLRTMYTTFGYLFGKCRRSSRTPSTSAQEPEASAGPEEEGEVQETLRGGGQPGGATEV